MGTGCGHKHKQVDAHILPPNYSSLPHSGCIMPPQMLHQTQAQVSYLERGHESRYLAQGQSQSQFGQSNRVQQHQNSFNGDHGQEDQRRQELQQLIISMSQICNPNHHLRPVCQQPSFTDSDSVSPDVSPLQSLLRSYTADESSHIFNLPRNPSVASSSDRPSKRAALDREPHPPLCAGSQSLLPQSEQQRGESRVPNLPRIIASIPPFPGRECSIEEQEGSTDPQDHLLFGVPASLLLQNGISNSSFPASSFMSNLGSDFTLNPTMTPSSCIDESATMRELGGMFGLERQLEDPVRSGWQLVFVDRDNDVLLVGDDPWPEFVNSMWCIKILSPPEVEEMGKRGLELLNSVQLSGNG